MSEQANVVQVSYEGEAFKTINELAKKFGVDQGVTVSGAISLLSAVQNLMDSDGYLTVQANGKLWKVKVPLEPIDK